MSLSRFIRRLFPKSAEEHLAENEPRYDNVSIVSAVDGTTITGHDAIKAYFDQEQELLDKHGSSLIFQVYRLNLQANTLDELQGEMLAEMKVDPEFVSGSDTVAVVKSKVRSMLEAQARAAPEAGAQPGPTIKDDDSITLLFGGRRMRDETLLYADNFVMLPAWVQVMLHEGEFEGVATLVAELRSKSPSEPTP